MRNKLNTSVFFLAAISLLALLCAPPTPAEDFEDFEDGEDSRLVAKAGVVTCDDRGCVGEYSEVIDHLMTRDMGEVRVVLSSELRTEWAATAETVCVFAPNINHITLNPRQDADGGDGNVLTQLLVAKTLEGRIYLRFTSDTELGCRLAYMRLL